MADSLLKTNIIVKNEFIYRSLTETLRENYLLFNGATKGGLIMLQRNHVGDFSDEMFWKFEDGLTRFRNPYQQDAIPSKSLKMLSDTMVKIGRGFGPISFQPTEMGWIGQSEESHSVALGSQIAAQEMREQLNIAITAFIAATQNKKELVYDAPDVSWRSLIQGLSLMGDQYEDVACWVMSSKTWFSLIDANLQNQSSLFVFGTVNVKADPLGKPIIITDNAVLGSENVVLGLTRGAVEVHDTGYYKDAINTITGKTNIETVYQAEYDIELGVKGFAWDAKDANKAPDLDKIKNKAMWKPIVTSHKDMAGVLIKLPSGSAAPAAGA